MVGCGGGGGSDDQGDVNKVCNTPGYGLYCPQTNGCCVDNQPYACQACFNGICGQVTCSEKPCNTPTRLIDFCEEE